MEGEKVCDDGVLNGLLGGTWLLVVWEMGGGGWRKGYQTKTGSKVKEIGMVMTGCCMGKWKYEASYGLGEGVEKVN